jgi:hypothetical protein
MKEPSARPEQHEPLWPTSAVYAAELRPTQSWPPANCDISSRERREASPCKHLQRGESPRLSHPLLPVETVGIEPTSAVA